MVVRRRQVSPSLPLVRRARRMASVLAVMLCAGLGKVHAHEQTVEQGALRVASAGWGNTRAAELRFVLAAVAAEFGRHFPGRDLGRVEVVPGEFGPMVLYERAADGAYVVKLSARDGRWFQFVYQFAHELCHIYSNFDRKRGADGRIETANQWFEESICEAAALFTLRSLAREWSEAEAGSLQARHAGELRAYADYFLGESHRQLPARQSFASWFRTNHSDLADNPYHRQRNELVANVLLPYFEQNPDNWEVIAFLNPDSAHAAMVFEEYLEQWLHACPVERREVVERVMHVFGVRPTGEGDAGNRALAGDGMS